MDYPAACNAIEKLLVHEAWANKPGTGQDSGVAALKTMLESAGVQVRRVHSEWVALAAAKIAGSSMHTGGGQGQVDRETGFIATGAADSFSTSKHLFLRI